jgi:hypothetical protein
MVQTDERAEFERLLVAAGIVNEERGGGSATLKPSG